MLFRSREYAIGIYMIASNVVMEFQSNYAKKVYVAPKGTVHTTSESAIRSTYNCIGTIPASTDGKGSDWWIGDIAVDTITGAFYPSKIGSSDSQGFGDRVYAGGANTSGFREYPLGGLLWAGSVAGSVCLFCGSGLSWAGWNFGGCD